MDKTGLKHLMHKQVPVVCLPRVKRKCLWLIICHVKKKSHGARRYGSHVMNWEVTSAVIMGCFKQSVRVIQAP